MLGSDTHQAGTFKTGYRCWIGVLVAAFALGISSAARGTEGGASLYLPGSYNDFLAGVFGPSGLYFRNDFFPQHGKVSRAPIGGRLFKDVEQRVWANSLKFFC